MQPREHCAAQKPLRRIGPSDHGSSVLYRDGDEDDDDDGGDDEDDDGDDDDVGDYDDDGVDDYYDGDDV